MGQGLSIGPKIFPLFARIIAVFDKIPVSASCLHKKFLYFSADIQCLRRYQCMENFGTGCSYVFPYGPFACTGRFGFVGTVSWYVHGLYVRYL